MIKSINQQCSQNLKYLANCMQGTTQSPDWNNDTYIHNAGMCWNMHNLYWSITELL